MEQMKQWHSKEFSKLTNVTVRTLHHYDRIGLLKPTMRSTNGYRWYTTTDLVILQQIIALKFFGFSLSQIKTMLQQQPSMLEHLRTQQQMLNDQVSHLQQAQTAMATLILQLSSTGSFDWQHLTTLIERYHMTQELKNTWVGKALNEAQLAQYMALRQKYPKEFKTWDTLNQEINSMALGDPEGPEGHRVAKTWIELMTKMKDVFKEFSNIAPDMIHDIKAGKITEMPLTPEGNAWLGKAILAYGLQRWNALYHDITKYMHTDPMGAEGKKMAAAWRALIDEMLCAQTPDFVFGTLVWHTMTLQKKDLDNQKTPLTAQELADKIEVPLFLDSAATNWISTALSNH